MSTEAASGAEFLDLDAVGLAALIAAGEVSPMEVLDATIERIERLDPEINAIIHRRFERARAEVEAGLADGPFTGVPITIKDLWPTSAGDPFHLGVRGMKDAKYCHPTDSNLVTRYREAGFVIVGRTNTPELGLSATTEPLAYGPTRNPWNLDYGPGGSSGGAAASVAAGITTVANASDGGGSIRIPAAHCGLVGLKVSRGRTSMGPMAEEWGSSVQHCVARTVRDTATVLDASCGHFMGDGVVAPVPPNSFAYYVGTDPGSLRIGYTTHSRDGVDTAPECADATVKLAELLESLGHQVESDQSPDALHGSAESQSMAPITGVGVKAHLKMLGDLIGRPLEEDDVEPGTWLMAQMGDSVSGLDYAAAAQAQHKYRRRMLSWWEQDWDLLLTPTTAHSAPRLGEIVPTDDNPFQSLLGSIPHAAFTSAFNITGQPAISIPAGFTSEGLPLGAQLVAAYGREDQLIAVAAQLETALGWAGKRPTPRG